MSAGGCSLAGRRDNVPCLAITAILVRVEERGSSGSFFFSVRRKCDASGEKDNDNVNVARQNEDVQTKCGNEHNLRIVEVAAKLEHM
jgi:hypothetical protein